MPRFFSSHRRVCTPPPPFGSGGGEIFACGRGGGGVPIRTRGQTLWYSRYIFTLKGQPSRTPILNSAKSSKFTKRFIIYPSRIPDPRVKKIPDPGSLSATLLVMVPVCPLLVELAADNFLDSEDDPVLSADTDGGSAILHRLLRVLNLNEFLM